VQPLLDIFVLLFRNILFYRANSTLSHDQTITIYEDTIKFDIFLAFSTINISCITR